MFKPKFIWVVLWMIAMSSVLFAQTPQQPPVFRAGVDLIEVDVTVVDGENYPVSDLEASDFMVTVGGKSRRVAQVQYISLRPVEQAEVAFTAGSEEIFSSSNANQPPGRLILVGVDEESILFGEGRHVMRAASEFIDSLNPVDRVALAVIPHGVHMDFTGDHNRVRREVERLSGLGTQSGGRFDIGISEAYRIAMYGDSEALREVVARVCSSGFGAIGCPEQVRGESRMIVEAQRYQARNALYGLESLLVAMRELEGPNALVWISGGFVAEDALNLKRIEELAATSRTTLYVMGVDEPLVNARQASSRSRSTIRGDQRMKIQGLMALSSMTNGRFIRTRYNPGPLFERVGRELSGYYLLGVESRPVDREKNRSRIEVTVNRSDVQVRARREVGEFYEGSGQTVDERLARMLRSPLSIQELPLRVATYAYRETEHEKIRIQVVAEVDAAVSVPSPLTVGVVLRNPDGVAVLTQQQRMVATPGHTAYGPVLQTSFPLIVPGGSYSLRVAVVDSSGQRGSVSHPVNAEVTSQGPLSVGSLVVADEVSIQPSGVQAPVQARVLGDNLVVYTELYVESPLVWEKSRVHVSVADTIKDPARTRTTVTFDGLGDMSQSVVLAKVPVDDLPPGRYFARLRVIYDSGEIIRLHRLFWITDGIKELSQ